MTDKLIPYPRDARMDEPYPDQSQIDYDLLLQEVEISVEQTATDEYLAYSRDWPAIVWTDETPEDAAEGFVLALAAHLELHQGQDD